MSLKKIPQVGFLFDLDGVLIDSLELHWQAWKLLERKDPRCQLCRKTYVDVFGKKNEDALRELFPTISPALTQVWAAEKERLFREVILDGKVSLFPGMEKFLEEIKHSQLPLIIASSTPVTNLNFYLQKTILGSYFKDFVSGEEVPFGKPYPDIFLAAAHKIKMPPEKCIVIEDSLPGLQAGRSAGCFVIALETTRKKAELDFYDVVYPSPQALHLSEVLESFAS